MVVLFLVMRLRHHGDIGNKCSRRPLNRVGSSAAGFATQTERQPPQAAERVDPHWRRSQRQRQQRQQQPWQPQSKTVRQQNTAGWQQVRYQRKPALWQVRAEDWLVDRVESPRKAVHGTMRGLVQALSWERHMDRCRIPVQSFRAAAWVPRRLATLLSACVLASRMW